MKRISLPIEPNLPSDMNMETYSYYSFRYKLDGLGTFIGEVLLATGLFMQEHAYKDFDKLQFTPKLYLNDMPEEKRREIIKLREKYGRSAEIMSKTSWFYEEPVSAPGIVWHPREGRQNLSGDLLRGLFHTAITQLVSIYEVFIEDIARELYRKNHDLLAIDERQLTSAEIVTLGSYDGVIESLTERAVRKLTFNVSYPDLVKRFHGTFHIGIHDSHSPVRLFRIHHLIEKRNIIVHNDGKASALYREKMADYSARFLLKEDDELPVNFISFYEDLVAVRKLGTYIEKCVQKRWCSNLDFMTYAKSQSKAA